MSKLKLKLKLPKPVTSLDLDTFMPLNEAIDTIDYFTLKEKDQVSEIHKLPSNSRYATPNLRASLLKAMLTRPSLESAMYRDLLVTNYKVPMHQDKAQKKLYELYFSSYYTMVSPHSQKELSSASKLIFCYRDGILRANVPPICLVVIGGYYQVEIGVCTNAKVPMNAVSINILSHKIK